jgi:hypothetical protein
MSCSITRKGSYCASPQLNLRPETDQRHEHVYAHLSGSYHVYYLLFHTHTRAANPETPTEELATIDNNLLNSTIDEVKDGEPARETFQENEI